MRRYRVVIMLVLLGVLPVVAVFFLTLSYLKGPEPEPDPDRELAQAEVEPVVEDERPAPEPQMRRVLVASRELPVGTLLRDEDLTEVEVESDAVASGHVLAPVDAAGFPLRGYLVRETLGAGARVTWTAVVGPDQSGFLAAVLNPGKRAVTIRVGPATGHAGLVDPGDRVDVILSAELAFDGGDRSVFATTIVEDARVLAVDRRIGSAAGPPPEGEEGEAGPERTEVTTATLEVTPAQGERLVLGEREGALSLAVRSLAPPTTGTANGASAGTSVELKEMLLPPAAFSASQERLRRAQRLNALSMRRQLAEAEQELQAAKAAGATTLDTVRIFRGSEPAEEVVFANR